MINSSKIGASKADIIINFGINIFCFDLHLMNEKPLIVFSFRFVEQFVVAGLILSCMALSLLFATNVSIFFNNIPAGVCFHKQKNNYY